MEIVKVIYELRYPILLNFKEIYKSIINPYFIYPNAQYAIANEGSHKESIKLTLPDSFVKIIFANDLLSFQFDGSLDDLKGEGSNIGICFEIFNKLKLDSSFTKLSMEVFEIVTIIESDDNKGKIQDDFVKKYTPNKIIRDLDDVAIIEEGIWKEHTTRIQYGPFQSEREIEVLSIMSLNPDRQAELKNKNGIICRATLKKEASEVNLRSFKKIGNFCVELLSKLES